MMRLSHGKTLLTVRICQSLNQTKVNWCKWTAVKYCKPPHKKSLKDVKDILSNVLTEKDDNSHSTQTTESPSTRTNWLAVLPTKTKETTMANEKTTESTKVPEWISLPNQKNEINDDLETHMTRCNTVLSSIQLCKRHTHEHTKQTEKRKNHN